jgi:hypothetical protein
VAKKLRHQIDIKKPMGSTLLFLWQELRPILFPEHSEKTFWNKTYPGVCFASEGNV